MSKVVSNVKENILSYSLVVVCLIFLCSNIISFRQLRQFRKLSESLGTELDNERNLNRRLGETIIECREVTDRIRELSAEDTTTIRGCIELVRQIRTQIEILETSVDSFYVDSNSLYNNNGGDIQ